MSQPTFDLCHPDGLAFDTEPDSFVMLERDPPIWTTRGIAYFSPRFRMIGIAVADITSGAEFWASYDRWSKLEYQLLMDKISAQANSIGAQLEHRALMAILLGDVNEAQRLESLVHHRNRACLRVVGGSGREDG